MSIGKNIKLFIWCRRYLTQVAYLRHANLFYFFFYRHFAPNGTSYISLHNNIVIYRGLLLSNYSPEMLSLLTNL